MEVIHPIIAILIFEKYKGEQKGSGCFARIGVPQNGWFTMEHPIKMDDLGAHPYFRKHPYSFMGISHKNSNWQCISGTNIEITWTTGIWPSNLSELFMDGILVYLQWIDATYPTVRFGYVFFQSQTQCSVDPHIAFLMRFIRRFDLFFDGVGVALRLRILVIRVSP